MLDPWQSNLILSLRLLIARAAQKDSLSWWDDESLTDAGDYLLKRLFTNAPQLAGRKLALQAGHARHQKVFSNDPKAVHLFRLDLHGQVELALKSVQVKELDVVYEPIGSMGLLKEKMKAILGSETEIAGMTEKLDRKLEIRLKEQGAEKDPTEIAKILAWSYLHGDVGNPVFPYLPMRG